MTTSTKRNNDDDDEDDDDDGDDEADDDEDDAENAAGGGGGVNIGASGDATDEEATPCDDGDTSTAGLSAHMRLMRKAS